MTPDKVPDVVYGVAKISEVICEPNLRRVYYLLEHGHIQGAWKAGAIWALTVPRWRRAVGLEP